MQAVSADERRQAALLAIELVRFGRPSLGLDETRKAYLSELLDGIAARGEQGDLRELALLCGQLVGIAGSILDHLDTQIPACADQLLDVMEQEASKS